MDGIKKDRCLRQQATARFKDDVPSLKPVSNYISQRERLQVGIARCRQLEHLSSTFKDVREILESIRDDV